MRKRVAKELGTILGVVLVLAVLAFANSQLTRSDLASQYERIRNAAEALQEKSGEQLMKWDLLHGTRGTIKSGPTFPDKLTSLDKQTVSLVGFMMPIDQFREASYFMLLPLPIQCFFCAQPPMRDVMLVEMAKGETARVVEEPVIVNGTLNLHPEPGSQYFYSIKDAKWAGATKEGALTTKNMTPEHRMHMLQQMMMKGPAGTAGGAPENSGSALMPGETPPATPGGVPAPGSAALPPAPPAPGTPAANG